MKQPVYMSFAQGPDGNLYGTTSAGGANAVGTVFSMTPGGAITTIYSFCNLANCADGNTPWAGLTLGTDGDYYGTTVYGGTGSGNCTSCGIVFKITPQGTLTPLHSFNGADGSRPRDQPGASERRKLLWNDHSRR